MKIKQLTIERFAEYLHNAGLNAFTHPHNQSAEDWHEYREKIAKQLMEYGIQEIIVVYENKKEVKGIT